MFQWSALIPSGHRSLTSETSLLRKSFSSVNLISPEGKYIDLLETDMVTEIDKLTLITGAVGVFSGMRNNTHRGFIISSAGNSQDIYDENSKLIHEKYQNFDIAIAFPNENIFRLSVQHLMDLVYLQAHISIMSIDNVPLEKTESLMNETEPRQKMTKAERIAYAKTISKDLTEEECIAIADKSAAMRLSGK